MTIASIALRDGGASGTIVTDTAIYIYLNGLPGSFLPLCPRCGCCTYVDPEGNGIGCVGFCDDPEAKDHSEVFGRYCPACLGEHHGPVCPELTRGLA